MIARFAGLSREDMALRRRRPGIRWKLNGITYMVTGVTFGVLAARIGFVWVDITLTVLALTSMVVAYVTGSAFGRGARDRSGDGARGLRTECRRALMEVDEVRRGPLSSVLRVDRLVASIHDGTDMIEESQEMKRVHLPPAHLHMVGNAHIDPMWIWDWREGMHEVLQTFRSAVDRLDEEPALVFTASSASYYHWVQQTSPALFGRIKELVAQQRWIVTGGQWVEPDCNLPSGESVCRQLLYGQRYLAEHLGITASVGYNIDSFGHAGTLPQLLARSGIEAYVMMRPGEHEKAIDAPTFWWEGVDGSSLIAYRILFEYSTEGSYEGEVIRWRTTELLQRSDQLGCPLMMFFGVGDHGGGPTRLAVRTIRELSTTSNGSVGFSSPVGYFEAVRESMARGEVVLPRVTGELQWHAVGCYSARASLKRGNARAEDALVTAEKMAELCRTLTGRTSTCKKNCARPGAAYCSPSSTMP